ncbi:DMT family transporter [Halobaculum litoreum]|uniref:DMT family transporter n=1 Tax=Halobaculum litoreum TaxID=3031998 RepID=UPI0024C37F80|nr:EamA family transporter [Halobaculum sp. DT92]
MSPGVRRYGYALAPLLAAAIWGGMYVVSTWTFATVPPLTLGFLRVAVGAAALYAVVRVRGVTVDRADYRRFAVLGGWVAATIATQFLGTAWTNASQGSLLTVLTPVFTVALGAWVLDETVTRRKALGVALAGVGTLVVLAGRYDPAAVAVGNVAGVGALVLASVAWAGYTVWGVPVVRKYSALTAATYSTVASLPVLAALAAVELAVRGPSLAAMATPGALLAVGYLGLGSTAAAWYLWYKGLETVSAGTVAAFFFAQPLVGTLLGALLLNEAVGPWFVVGGAVMAVGIWTVATAGGDGDDAGDDGDRAGSPGADGRRRVPSAPGARRRAPANAPGWRSAHRGGWSRHR